MDKLILYLRCEKHLNYRTFNSKINVNYEVQLDYNYFFTFYYDNEKAEIDKFTYNDFN